MEQQSVCMGTWPAFSLCPGDWVGHWPATRRRWGDQYPQRWESSSAHMGGPRCEYSFVKCVCCIVIYMYVFSEALCTNQRWEGCTVYTLPWPHSQALPRVCTSIAWPLTHVKNRDSSCGSKVTQYMCARGGEPGNEASPPLFSGILLGNE